MSTYDAALQRYRRNRAKADDEAQMAGFCAETLQLIVGAVSPKLVWAGAVDKGLTNVELMKLAALDPMAVSDLQWL